MAEKPGLTRHERRVVLELAGQYDQYNDEYFDGKLPTLSFVVTMEKGDAAMAYDQENRRIEIARDCIDHGNRANNIRLLHEMAHVKLRDLVSTAEYGALMSNKDWKERYETIVHGASFWVEIKRLIEVGAYRELL